MIFKDTAGIRKSTGTIEKKGVEKAIKASSQSAVNLVILQKKSEIRYYEKKFENTILCKSKYDIPGKKNKFKVWMPKGPPQGNMLKYAHHCLFPIQLSPLLYW